MDAEATSADKPKSAGELVASHRVLIIAHRGASSVAPENTLPAFKEALARQADLVELDYMHTADGVPVVFHDEVLDRTTNCLQLWHKRNVAIADKHLDQLRALDAGAWFGPDFTGTRIPTLEQALDTIQAGSTTLIERKSGDAATCIALLKRKQLLDRVVVQAFDWKFLADCHKLAPELALAALGEKELTAAALARAPATGAKVIAWEERCLGEAEIKSIHSRGWKAWAWTVDDLERGRALRDAGIDAIITNLPAEMRSALAAP